VDTTTYMLALPKRRAVRGHWQHACRLILDGADVEAITRQVELSVAKGARI